MAFNSTVTTENWHVLLEIALDGGTVRYADADLALDDGTAYDGRIASVPALRLSTGQILDPRLVSPSLVVTLRDTDSVVRDSTDSEEWGNRAVTLKIGQGTTAADYETVFTGVVRFPGGITWDATTLRVSVDDLRGKDSAPLPANRLDPSTYSNMESSAEYKAIPLIYGDFRAAAGGGETVPCYQIDSTAGTGGKFKIADHALKEIEVVYLNGSDITGNCTLDATNGEFTISSTSTYDSTTDTVTANVQGATDDGTTSGTLLQTLPDILDDLLQTHLGVASGNIDATAFTAWENELTTNDYGRRWIGTEIASDELIRDLLVEGFADITIEAGKYTPVYRVVEPASGASAFTSANIRERGDATKDFTVTRDPERIFANEIVAEYRTDPTATTFKQTYTTTDSASVANLGTTKRRRLSMRWLYLQTGAQNRATRELYLFSDEPETANMRLDPEALTFGPTDQFRLTHDKYESAPFQVRTISLDLIRKQATATCWNMLRLTPGRWTSSSAPAWSSATSTQRLEQGFWTDSNGRADSGDANSTGSIWF